jgi:hypothetical protein
MAKIRVTGEFVAEMLFGFSPHIVDITDARFDFARREFEFDISGIDVPDVEEVRGEFTVQHNRRQERLHTLEFKPA